MKPKVIVKIVVDIGMTVILLLLMAYELIGQVAHEWFGIGMFLLFIVHHILNKKWGSNVLKGKYTVYRVLQTVLVVLVLISMLGSMVSGVIISRHALSFLPIEGGHSFARTIHMVSGYWGFVFMSLHLGFHWSMMMGMAKKMIGSPSVVRKLILWGMAIGIAGYGLYAFIQRDIGSYMILQNQFVFFDFNEPLVLFFIDYIAVMGLFVFVGHCLSEWLKQIQYKKKHASY